MRKIFILGLLALALSAPCLNLSLNTVRELALKNNPDLQAARAQTAAANASQQQALFGLMPSASLEGNYQRFDQAPQSGVPGVSLQDRQYSYNLQVSQPLLAGGKIWQGWQISKDTYKMQQQTLVSTSLQVMTNVESAYFDVLQATELLDIAQKSVESSAKHLDMAQTRFDAGTLSIADYLNVQSEHANKQVALIRQQNGLEIARLNLANLLQIDPDYTLEPVNLEAWDTQLEQLQGFDAVKTQAMVRVCLANAMQNSPALASSKLGVDISSKSLWMAKGSFLPTLTAVYQKNWLESTDSDNDMDDSGTLMLTASLPLFPLVGDYKNVEAARWDLRRSEINHTAAIDGIKLGVRSAVYNYVAAARTVKASQVANRYATQTFTRMEERFNGNLINAADLLDAELLLNSAQNSLATAWYDFLRARSTLVQQLGSQQPQIIEQLIEEVEE